MLFILAMQQHQSLTGDNENIIENTQMKSHIKEAIQAQSKLLQRQLKQKVREMQNELNRETNSNLIEFEQNDDFLFDQNNSRDLLHHVFGGVNANQRTRSPDMIRRHKKKKIKKEEINFLQEKKVKKNLKDKLQDKSCSICLNEFNVGEHISYLPCCHVYHSKCIKKWLKIANLCPLCKEQVKP